jgi:hypothetical protein
MDIQRWVMSPSTINGIGSIVGLAAGLIAHIATHDTTAAAAAGVLTGAVVHLLMPDNTAAQNSIEKLVQDTIMAAEQKKLAEKLPTLVAEAMQAFSPPAPQAFAAPPVTTTVIATTTPANQGAST